LDEAPSTGEECNALVYLVPPSFRNQVSTGASSKDIYDLDLIRSLGFDYSLNSINRKS